MRKLGGSLMEPLGSLGDTLRERVFEGVKMGKMGVAGWGRAQEVRSKKFVMPYAVGRMVREWDEVDF